MLMAKNIEIMYKTYMVTVIIQSLKNIACVAVFSDSIILNLLTNKCVMLKCVIITTNEDISFTI